MQTSQCTPNTKQTDYADLDSTRQYIQKYICIRDENEPMTFRGEFLGQLFGPDEQLVAITAYECYVWCVVAYW